MTVQAPSQGRILASAGFRAARLRAGVTSGSAAALSELLDGAGGEQTVAKWSMSDVTRLHLDILCAVVEARMETLELSVPNPADALTITAAARLNLVVATLLYVTGTRDFDRWSEPTCEEIAALLRWASRAVYSELPV